MTICRKCRYYDGEQIIENRIYFICGVDGDTIEECVAMDDNLGCDLYVEELDDNKTKKP